jgi:hypothetical protein
MAPACSARDWLNAATPCELARAADQIGSAPMAKANR